MGLSPFPFFQGVELGGLCILIHTHNYTHISLNWVWSKPGKPRPHRSTCTPTWAPEGKFVHTFRGCHHQLSLEGGDGVYEFHKKQVH